MSPNPARTPVRTIRDGINHNVSFRSLKNLRARSNQLPVNESVTLRRRFEAENRDYLTGDAFSREFCFFTGSLHRFLSRASCLRARLAFIPYLCQLFVGEMFNSNKRIVHGTYTDQFIELDLDRSTVSILRILDQEDHQERDDSRPRVDDQLPSVRVVK